MKLLFACVCAMVLGANVNGEKDTCPMNNITSYGFFFHTIHSVSTWAECGDFCFLTDGCQFWTWDTNDHGCWLKNDDYGYDAQDYRISGYKNCY